MTTVKARTLTLCTRLWRDYMRQDAGRLLLAVFFMAVTAAATAGTAKLIEPTLDEVFIKKDEILLGWLVIGFFALLALRGTGNFVQILLLNGMGMRVVRDLQTNMFRALQGADLQYIHDEGAGKQLSRFSSDALLLRQTVSKVFTGAGRDFLTVLFLIAVMFHTNWKMSLAAFIFFPISLYPIQRIGRRLRKVADQTQKEMAGMIALLDDALRGLRQIKAYNRQDYEAARAGGMFERMRELTFKSVRTRSLSHPILDMLSGLSIAGIIGWGGLMIIEGELTVGQFMAFFVAVFAAYQPIRSLANLNASLQEGLAAAQRIFDLIDYEPHIQDAPDADPIRPGPGRVELRNVTFRYQEEATSALQNISLVVKPGQTVALVGPSGAGKSTLLNLVPRFYDVTEGTVLVDGQDVRSVTMASLRERIALVSQEVSLFNDSIRANIAYGRLDATEEEIVKAARAAVAHDFIMSLPEGYDTVVGEMGVRLSGGQRQRLSIARAILKNAPILLLDEATSALDTESERQVQAALDHLMQGRTTIIVAHRLSTIHHADLICVMEDGRIVETGTHSTLLAHDGLYARLSRMQFQEETVPALGITP